jgi:hypothetical protein
MGTIRQAAKWLGQGKSVRRKCWSNSEYAIEIESVFVNSTICVRGEGGNPAGFDLSDLLATDWEHD